MPPASRSHPKVRLGQEWPSSCTHHTTGRSVWQPWYSTQVHRRIEGGSSSPRPPFSPGGQPSVRAATARQDGIDRLISAQKCPPGPRGAVYPMATPPRSRSVQPVIAATRIPGRRARRSRVGRGQGGQALGPEIEPHGTVVEELEAVVGERRAQDVLAQG